MKTENPERIYVDSYVGTNGIRCLDYKNYDDSIEYIRSDLVSNDVHSLLAEVRAIIEEMVDPINYLENEAKKAGGLLNGGMAIQISNDIEFYKSRARRIMQKISEHFS